MEAYGNFAAVYDRLMDDFDYPAWADYYLRLVRRAGVEPKNICDCACGTGSLSVEFARGGLKVTGVDLSQDMLELAAQKARKNGVMIPFVCQDMCRLQLPRKVDALICGCDGVNYLTTDARVLAFFRAAHAQIKPGGVLAFDVSSQHKLCNVMGDSFFGEERDEVAYLWQNKLENDIVTMDLTFFVQTSEGLYRRFSETHRQRAHTVENLSALLVQAGFTNVQVYGGQSFDAPRSDEMRIHFTAIRE